jgi:hypothetical protein
MSQHDYNIANQGFSSFRSDLNNALSAIQTTNSGTSRPTGAVAGQLWLDTTTATSPTLKYYDGADDISLATIDHTANTVNWLDSTVSITGLSTTATGTVLTLTDSANTTTVNLIIDNQKEVRFRETTANGTNFIGLKAPASVTADLTFTLPATDGTAGQVLQTNGSGVLSFATVGGLAWQSIVTASTLTAVAGRGYWINTTSNACTVTLPASATNGDTIILADYARTWGTNAVTINTNSLNFQGNTTPSPIYNTSRQSVTLVYSGATQGWIPTVDDDVTLETPQPYAIDFLVVAGGAGGGATVHGGGGGAGGFRTSTQTVSAGVAITVTVGDGGAGGLYANNRGSNGSNSSISGSGLTTITSAGGGGGGAGATGLDTGVSGGSGGGGAGNAPSYSGAGGSGNTPSTSPSQGNNGGAGYNTGNPSYSGGGGGGAGAVGGNGTSTNGGNGGNGTASSITGSSVTYAGGGGGSSYNGTSGGTGGTGGGGAGSLGQGADGTVNTGGGGGGSERAGNFNGGSGGKGVVILSMPSASYSSTTTGFPTVTTSGSNTILTFTGSGTYTT